MSVPSPHVHSLTRRHFLKRSQAGLGALALASLMGDAEGAPKRGANPVAPKTPHFPAKAKHVIYLHMAGSPPQQELFDDKPALRKFNLKPCPDSLLEVLKKERLPFIKLSRGRPKLLGSPYKFQPRGECGAQISELLPHFSRHADDVCLIRSMFTDQFNHAPAQLSLYTGSPRFGGASMGAWALYGLGSENENLPGFVVLVSGGTDPSGGKSLWGSGFLPSVYQGVQCRTVGEPILYVTNPKGMSRDVRRRSLDALKTLNELELKEFGDPETLARINQYELAFRMQMSVPNVMNMAREPKHVHVAYGTQPGKESFANNCLLARRLVEQGVRYVQLFHYGWDMHGTGKGNDLITAMPKKCKEIDRPIAALLSDLKKRGLFDETLVVWSGEFGRTSLNEERNGSKFLGRDHHPHCFSIWMAGGGVKGGQTVGRTDDLGYFITENKISLHDLQATILHLLGFDAKKFSYPYQGLDQRLIGPTDDPKVRKELLA
ncbi:MAG: DUF1501 domain-containing protein [Planctomycetaceae bacterium]